MDKGIFAQCAGASDPPLSVIFQNMLSFSAALKISVSDMLLSTLNSQDVDLFISTFMTANCISFVGEFFIA